MVDAVPLTQIRDAYVDESRPSKNYSSTSRLILDATGANQKYAYLYFPKNYPIGVEIYSTKLRLYNADLWAGPVTLTIRVLSEKWAGSRVNWNNKPAVTGTAITLTKTDAPKGTLWEFELKDVIQAVSDGGSWFGLRLQVDGTARRRLHSAQSEEGELRPEVLVQYADDPEPPENLAPNGNRAVEVDKPWLTYDYIDISGDVTLAAHQFQINDDLDFLSPEFDTGWLATSEPGLDLNTTAFAGLANLESKRWRVRVRDGSGAESDWSVPAQMRREDKGAHTNGTLGTKVLATNRITSPRPTVAGAANWTGLNADGSMNAAIATSPNVVAPNNQYVTVLTRVRNDDTDEITVRVSGLSSAGASTVAPVEVVIPPGTATEIRWQGNTSPTSTGVRLQIEVTSGFSTGTVFIEQGLIVFGIYDDVFFSGASVDTGVIGPYLHAWTGAADASTSTRSVLYVQDTSPTIVWALAGQTQEAWLAEIANVGNLDNPTYTSGKVTGTENSVEPQEAAVKSSTATYRLTQRVWDDVPRERNGGREIYYEYVREFKYIPNDAVVRPVITAVDRAHPWPWMEIKFTRPTPPDYFSIFRDGELIRDKLDPGDLWEGGPTYIYRDRRANPRQNHQWTVVANVNGEDSRESEPFNGRSDPGVTWLMDENGTRPIAIVKSAATPETPIEAQVRTAQEVHQPVGGSNPVLITQYISGFEGSVEGVLSDDIVPGLTAQEMRDRLKYFKRYPGQTLLLYMVNEVLEVVAYNITYRPRAKSGKRIIYDISFELFEVWDRGEDFV